MVGRLPSAAWQAQPCHDEPGARGARRIALAAQGFGKPDAGRATPWSIVDRLQVIQVDPIRVLVRSRYIPAFSRPVPTR